MQKAHPRSVYSSLQESEARSCLSSGSLVAFVGFAVALLVSGEAFTGPVFQGEAK